MTKNPVLLTQEELAKYACLFFFSHARSLQILHLQYTNQCIHAKKTKKTYRKIPPPLLSPSPPLSRPPESRKPLYELCSSL